MLEEQVRVGLMVPDFVVAKHPLGYNKLAAEFGAVGFIGQVEELQDLLSEGFDEALGRFAASRQLKEAPELDLKKLTERRVLIDCGFDFSKEIEGIKKVYEAGIANKEWLDKELSKYTP